MRQCPNQPFFGICGLPARRGRAIARRYLDGVRTWLVPNPSTVTILRPAHAAGASFYWVKSAEEGPGAGGGGSASGWPDQPES